MQIAYTALPRLLPGLKGRRGRKDEGMREKGDVKMFIVLCVY